ncbi:MAG: NAD(P)/FAD-dependent oxidoreductase [Methylobacter sp.]|nr:NAD(P)/FAD-dependent oxidoreductase [Methylobacter sp.]
MNKNYPVIVGGGPAGIAAAFELVSNGVNCTLLDESPRVGGVMFRGPYRQGVKLDYLGIKFRHSMEALHAQFASVQNKVDLQLNTRVVGVGSNSRVIALNNDERIKEIPFSEMIITTGCHERSIPFPGWMLPGVSLLGGVQLQIKSGVVKPMGRTVVVGSGPLLLQVSCQLVMSGAEVVGVYEASQFSKLAREFISLSNKPQMILDGVSMLSYLKSKCIPIHYGWGIVRALGKDELNQVMLAPYDQNWFHDLKKSHIVEAETLAVGYGLIPRTQLSQQMGLSHNYNNDGCLTPTIDQWQQSSQRDIYVAGNLTGILGGEAAVLQGRIAALAILRKRKNISKEMAEERREHYKTKLIRVMRFRQGIDRYSFRGPGLLSLPDAATIICRCEHVIRKDIDNAINQGVEDLTSLKMRTRVGMGDCQGAMCVGYCSDRLRQETGRKDVGWITPRFPIDPIPFSAFEVAKELS